MVALARRQIRRLDIAGRRAATIFIWRPVLLSWPQQIDQFLRGRCGIRVMTGGGISRFGPPGFALVMVVIAASASAATPQALLPELNGLSPLPDDPDFAEQDVLDYEIGLGAIRKGWRRLAVQAQRTLVVRSPATPGR